MTTIENKETYDPKTDKELDTYEPILDPNNYQFTVYPIRYKQIWDNYKLQHACMWRVEEVNFAKDYDDFMTLNSDEQYFLKLTLAFFAASDGIVNFNLNTRFKSEIQIKEIEIAYDFQTMMENIHGEIYSLMLDTLIKDPDEKRKLFDAINTIPVVKKMADWAFKWIESDLPFAFRVVAFTIIEGVFFSGSFATIFWFKKYKNKGKSFMDGMIAGNKFISRDEGLHRDLGCEVYKILDHKLTTDQVNELMDEGVGIAQEFMREALPVKLIGMKYENMADYIEYIADSLLVELGHKKKYGKQNPFDFMKTIGMTGKANFFEVDSTDYQDAYILNNTKDFKVRILDNF